MDCSEKSLLKEIHLFWKIAFTAWTVGMLLVVAPWSSPMAGFGKQVQVVSETSRTIDTPWMRRDFIDMNRVFESVESDFSVEVVKAIAWYESEWQHTDQVGHPLVNGTFVRRLGQRQKTYDVGIMQINEDSHGLDQSLWDLEKIKIDPIYNIAAGVHILETKREYVRYLRQRKDWPRIAAKYDMAGHSELDMTLKAYNGLRRSWVYADKIHQLVLEKPWESVMVGELDKNRLRASTVAIRAKFVQQDAIRYREWPLRQKTALFVAVEEPTLYQMIRVLDEK